MQPSERLPTLSASANASHLFITSCRDFIEGDYNECHWGHKSDRLFCKLIWGLSFAYSSRLPWIIILTSIKLIVANINVSMVGAMTCDRRQPDEAGGDVDAAISGISAGHRSREQAQEPCEDVATPGILTPEFPQSYFPLIDTTRWGRL